MQSNHKKWVKKKVLLTICILSIIHTLYCRNIKSTMEVLSCYFEVINYSFSTAVHPHNQTACLPNRAALLVYNSSLLSPSDRCWPKKSLPETLTSLVLEHKHTVSHTVWRIWMSQLSSVSGERDLTTLICKRNPNCQSHKVVKFSPSSVC